MSASVTDGPPSGESRVAIRTSETLARQAAWLTKALDGSVLRGVVDSTDGTIALRPDSAVGRRQALIIDARRGAGGLYLGQSERPGGHGPVGSAIAARLPGCFGGVESLPGERIAAVRWQCGGQPFTLYFACFPSCPRLTLVDGHERVVVEVPAGPSSRVGHWVAPPPRSSGDGEHGERLAGRALNDEVATACRAGAAAAAERARHELSSTWLRRELVRVERALRGAEADGARFAGADTLRHEADLLAAAFHLLRRGARSVDAPEWAAGGTVRIELDPALDPKDQVARRYAAARRAERGASESLRRALALRAERDRLLGWRMALERGGSVPDEVLALAEGPFAPRREEAGPRLPYRVFVTQTGHTVWVGRGARDNDVMTFRHARGNDLWLHARGRTGAHVIVRSPGPSPPPELLLAAGALALRHAGLDGGESGDVSWTWVKHVGKAKGMAPGAVLLRDERVVYARVDEALLSSLRSAPTAR